MNKKFLIVIILLIVIAGVIMLVIKISSCSPIVGSEKERLGFPEDELNESRNFIALGDSFTKANNLSSSLKDDNPEYSFSTGTLINSIYKYLRDKGEKLIAVNLASSGATSSDILRKQVPGAGAYHPKYVTILIGGPDIGTGIAVDNFKDNLNKIIAGIKKNNAVVLMGTLPNIREMRNATYPSCRENKIGLQMENFTDQKIKEFNAAIAEVARQNDLILVDLYKVLSSEETSDYDCLHPNIAGQEKIAQEFIKNLR